MDAPPVNRLLQLLRQKPSDTSELSHSSQTLVSPGESISQAIPRSSTLSATESDIPPIIKSSTPSATQEEVSLAVAGLSKGQQRVLRFLLSNRDVSNHSRTIPIGYDAISRHCFLSRSGSRKVIGELCQRGLITRLETKRGETQGSVYLLESIILYATQSSTHGSEKSSTQPATYNDRSCSSSKELLLQDLILEGAFQDLHPRSLASYLDKFDTGEDFQNFLDIANACIHAAKEGHGKPIQNPHGFLFAQLRAGYINPPEGYKSRKVRAQEIRNQQLEDELATLLRLKERERELQFALFVARLSEADMARLDQEAQAQVKPNIGLSPEFQMERYKDGLLRQWFTQRQPPPQEP